MILPDLNLLLYAHNPHAPQFAKANAWWCGAAQAGELIGFPHEVLFGFVRIATNPRLGPSTISVEAAKATVDAWMSLPQAKLLLPGPDHFERVMNLMSRTFSSGPVVSDAILAAYAIANRATLCSNDTDFARFPGLSWVNPLVK